MNGHGNPQSVASPFSYMADMVQCQLSVSAGFSRPLGRVTSVSGPVVYATVPDVSVGEIVRIRRTKPSGEEKPLLAEVVGVERDMAVLAPFDGIQGLAIHAEVESTGQSHRVEVGDHLLGQVLDGMGEPLMPIARSSVPAGGQLESVFRPIMAEPPSALCRDVIDKPLATGVKAIDGLLTCGAGQRMGIFAAAGVGKSSLMAMLSRYAEVDVTVVVLIGERGREVREFIEHQLGPEGMKKAVVVVATSDKPALQRARAAHTGTAIAEYFRDQGKHVLLLMDSLTRYARAMREIGLASGEPPARRGYPASVFADLPRLLERAGKNDKGAITGFYTVLVEGDDMNEPVSDEVRSILDGHLVLSRALAEANHFPAIDVLASCSRVMNLLVSEAHLKCAANIRTLLAKYKDIEMLLQMGEYQKGSDPLADQAVARFAGINAFLQQHSDAHCSFEDMLKQMQALVNKEVGT